MAFTTRSNEMSFSRSRLRSTFMSMSIGFLPHILQVCGLDALELHLDPAWTEVGEGKTGLLTGYVEHDHVLRPAGLVSADDAPLKLLAFCGRDCDQPPCGPAPVAGGRGGGGPPRGGGVREGAPGP